ncbi:MAG: hypothetical protein MR355_08950 [Lachnospiraceae bacterium]|nr:hypothetical protein [Lachnospiraceae bacterium]
MGGVRKMLVGNYVKGSIYLNKDELNKYECIPYMTKDYPAAFLLGSEYRNDMNSMAEKLEAVGAHYVLVDPLFITLRIKVINKKITRE